MKRRMVKTSALLLVALTVFASFVAIIIIKCLSKTSYRPSVIKLNPDEKDPLFRRIQQVWLDNAVDRGGMKTYGGAGRVIWLKDGQLVDVAWWHEVGTTAKLKQRTLTASVAKRGP